MSIGEKIKSPAPGLNKIPNNCNKYGLEDALLAHEFGREVTD